MKLQEMTWQEVEATSREVVVLIPTGSLEQHGPHLPLFTDSLLVGAVANAVEAQMAHQVLLTPTLWLGASGHHLAFPGTLSNSFEAYIQSIESVVESLVPHGFRKFYVINGHGGNNDPNGVAMRKLKAKYLTCTFGYAGYSVFADQAMEDSLKGPTKTMRHACEAEASLMLHLYPELVRKDLLRNDGLRTEPPVRGVVHHFDEMTEQGSFGEATFATAETGKVIFEAAVQGVCAELKAICEGYVLVGNRALE